VTESKLSVPAGRRQIAVWTHNNRPQAVEAASRFVSAMTACGVECLVRSQVRPIIASRVDGALLRDISPRPNGPVEVVVVFGGDGTILRAAEWALEEDIPLVGVNLGHIGFLAELEVSQFDQLIDHVLRRDYVLDRRLTVAVDVWEPGQSQPSWSSFAVNEVSLEKGSRQIMIEVVASVDQLPVSRWSCDGVLVATPTGSTAYAFSAGGAIMWPELEAFQLVPLSAHALFARPLVVGPDSVVRFDLVTEIPAVLWCDGKRTVAVEPGSRIEVRRGSHWLNLARLSVQPFTSRLVKKFALPVAGWRGQGVHGAD
jgi:NAD+ kinase